MQKIRARIQGKKNIYVHNDLSNAAHHFLDQIKIKLKAENRKGIAFEYMACLLMVALTLEAKVNFLGHKLVADWKERKPFNDKFSEVLNIIGITPDWTTRPYSSIAMLKKFRDSIAHGKPIEIEFDENIVMPEEEVDRHIDLDGEWLEYCAHDNVFNAYEDIQIIWDELLHLSKLEPYEALTHGSRSLTFIEKLVEK